MTRRTTNSPGAAPEESNQRSQHMQGSSHNHNNRLHPGRARPEHEETVNLQRGTDYDYDIGERRPSGSKGEMTNSDEIY